MQDQPAQTHYLGGGLAESAINPIVAGGMALAIVAVLGLPRRYAIVPLLLTIFLIPQGQEIYALGVHWLVSRIIILSGIASVIIGGKGSPFAGGFNAVDRAFAASVLCQAIAFVLLYQDGQALTNQFGFLIDYLGTYLVVRAMIHDEADVYCALKCLAFLTLILGFEMVREQLTRQNIFGLLGGVAVIPEIKEGKIRSQAVFQHPLTAGAFAATLVPMFLLLWYSGKARVSAAVGLLGCSVMTVCAHSSTPLLAYAAGLFAVCCWPIRSRMRDVRRGLVVSLVLLQLVMKAPVWFILSHIDLTGGSSGYHRAELVDQCIRHFWDWWLIGTKDAGTWGFDMWDSQNQYVQVAESGGLAALVFFIVMIKRLFASLGNARRMVESSPHKQWTLWLLGSALFANLTAFFGINYFDQSKVSWLMLLAAISAVTSQIIQNGSHGEQPLLTAASSKADLFHDASQEWNAGSLVGERLHVQS